jgi:hypothetical protein
MVKAFGFPLSRSRQEFVGAFAEHHLDAVSSECRSPETVTR